MSACAARAAGATATSRASPSPSPSTSSRRLLASSASRARDLGRPRPRAAGAFYTLVPTRPRSRGERRSLRTSAAGGGRRRLVAVAAKSSSTIAGIDLGTTNSAIAIVVDGEPVVVPDPATGANTIPSVVSYLASGDVLVGRDALRRQNADQKNTFGSVKRFIGKRFDDALAKEDARRVPYDVVAAKAATRGGGGGG